ncbi:MAG: efflux RND transporter periplasmic adaptor subunit [Bacteroidia bacterium]
MSRKNIIIIGASVVLLAAIIIVGKRKNKDEVEVHMSKIELKTIVSSVSANGKIRPEGEVRISADVSGEITELYINEGDTVQEGQLLLKIDPDLYVSALDRAKANLSSSQSSYNTNKALLAQSESRLIEQTASFNRSSKLFEQNVISQAEFDAVKTAYAIAQNDVKAAKERVSAAQFGIANAQASLNEAQKNLMRTSIHAPSDGVISALNAEKGERVVGTAQMAGTEILVISNFDNMEVIVDVNENDILQISKGDTSVIEVDAYPDRKFKGVVTEIARSASGLTAMSMSADQVTNFEVKIRITKSSYMDLTESVETPFLPGMSAGVEIQTKVVTEVPCLPIEAVTTRPAEVDSSNSQDELDEVVFSVENGKAVKHIIKTGIQDSRYIEIASGLDSIDQVIVGPYEAVSKKLKEGKKVKKVKKEENSWGAE